MVGEAKECDAELKMPLTTLLFKVIERITPFSTKRRLVCLLKSTEASKDHWLIGDRSTLLTVQFITDSWSMVKLVLVRDFPPLLIFFFRLSVWFFFRAFQFGSRNLSLFLSFSDVCVLYLSRVSAFSPSSSSSLQCQEGILTLL